MKSLLLIINNTAGQGGAQKDMYDIVKVLALGGYITSVCPVIPGEGLVSEQIIANEGENYDVIACYGGDGTLHHVINGYIKSGLDVPLGYFPAGSTNDFARSMGLDVPHVDIAKAIVKGNTFKYDAGWFGDSYFNYVAAFGAFTKVSYDTDQNFKNMIGHAAYIVNGITQLPDALTASYHARITHDGMVTEGYYLFGGFSNATSVGGFKMPSEERIKLNDGLFEVTLIKAPKNVIDLNMTVGALMLGDLESDYLEVFQTNEMTIEFTSPCAFTLDGEYGGEHRKVSLGVKEGAVNMLVP